MAKNSGLKINLMIELSRGIFKRRDRCIPPRKADRACTFLPKAINSNQSQR